MCVWKPADRRLFTISPCAIAMQNSLMASSYIHQKYSRWAACVGIQHSLGTVGTVGVYFMLGPIGETYWYTVLYISSHEGNNNLATTRHLSEFIRLLIVRFRVPFDLNTIPTLFSFPSPPFSLVFPQPQLKVMGTDPIWSHFICQGACELSLFMNSQQWELGLWAPHASGREDREVPRGAEFKAISCPDWDHSGEISELLSKSVCAYLLCVSEVSWG